LFEFGKLIMLLQLVEFEVIDELIYFFFGQVNVHLVVLDHQELKRPAVVGVAGEQLVVVLLIGVVLLAFQSLGVVELEEELVAEEAEGQVGDDVAGLCFLIGLPQR